ncbi:hypothetical protein L1987_68893 [Smallanthus sonchifolius]|uniref:Uncharacterized protein n=1 Tax=Smallanthus sonchifolius TaxID=185202 RepID=A0ACB9B688_9ASTR|nr:hypothetical protein L1987_68893 [Smallanthus sonchifolius]
MDAKTLIRHNFHLKTITITTKSNSLHSYPSPSQCRYTSRIQSGLKSSHYPLFRRNWFFVHVNHNRGVSNEEDYRNRRIFAAVTSVSDSGEGEEVVESNLAVVEKDLAGNESIWDQLVEILKFSGPAAGLWLCGPLMSLIDTAVIGQSSSVELAALGPGTVLCDYMSYGFMFLSIATSNLVATSLAKQVSLHIGSMSSVVNKLESDIISSGFKLYEDKSEVQHQISTLLFVGLTCGMMMLFFTWFQGEWALSAFSGAKNAHMLSAANTYVQVFVCLVTKMCLLYVSRFEAWHGLQFLLDGLLRVQGYGIAGAAWATMVSQVVAGFMMIEALKDKGYNGYAIAVPSAKYSSLLLHTMGCLKLFLAGGEPLSQTAQSFMPELLYGAKRSLSKARMLLKSLVIIGTSCGLILGAAGTIVPWLFPKVFSPDPQVIKEMHKVLLPYFIALSVTTSTHSLEGTLLAGRDLRFISISMSTIFALGTLLLMFLSNLGYGLPGCWWTLALFQWCRFTVALLRLISPNGVLYSEDMTRYELGDVSTA